MKSHTLCRICQLLFWPVQLCPRLDCDAGSRLWHSKVWHPLRTWHHDITTPWHINIITWHYSREKYGVLCEHDIMTSLHHDIITSRHWGTAKYGILCKHDIITSQNHDITAQKAWHPLQTWHHDIRTQERMTSSETVTCVTCRKYLTEPDAYIQSQISMGYSTCHALNSSLDARVCQKDCHCHFHVH